MWLEEFGDIDRVVLYVFLAVIAVIVVFAAVAIFLPCCVPSVKGVTPGGTIDFYIIIGGHLLAVSVLMRGLDLDWLKTDMLEAICQLHPAILLMGLSMFIGGLFVKAAAIYSFKWQEKPSVQSEEWKPNLGMWGLLILMGIVAVMWCIFFTPELSELVSQRFLCEGEAGFEWTVATSAWHGFLLLLAVIFMPMQCRASRKTPCRSESRALAVVIVNTLLVVGAGLCIRFVYTARVDVSPTVSYAINGGLMLWAVLIADICLLTGKVYVAKQQAEDAVYTEEDEERYDVIKDGSGEAMEMDGEDTLEVGHVPSQEDTEPFNY